MIFPLFPIEILFIWLQCPMCIASRAREKISHLYPDPLLSPASTLVSSYIFNKYKLHLATNQWNHRSVMSRVVNRVTSKTGRKSAARE